MNFEQKREIIDADPETGTYRATYAYPSDPPSIAIVHALMEVTEKDVTDFEPLYNISGVDPDALDEIFRPSTNDAGRDCRVSFQYYDYEIIVRSHGRIVIQSGDQQD
ncbi:hypothetical protein BRD15_04470 [Halobacteriales archaeon SW_6_65_15]|nr:MAG: hypothetical protein BRD15_04470 [Halobacteriales archaeon SW_6_65_15]